MSPHGGIFNLSRTHLTQGSDGGHSLLLLTQSHLEPLAPCQVLSPLKHLCLVTSLVQHGGLACHDPSTLNFMGLRLS